MSDNSLKDAQDHRRNINQALEIADNLTEQLRMAGLVQRDFLPSFLPNSEKLQWATSFLPAEWVSGDIFDVARIDEEHIGFYVADVVGHGIPAALLTIFFKQALVMRETTDNSYRIFSPSEVMDNLNKRITEQNLSGHQFITCCYCLLNFKTLELTFARAGHPYPVLFKKGQEPRQLEIQGSLLGIFDTAQYPQRTVQLEPGDKLLVYTDGAEHMIGNFDDTDGFCFDDQFKQLRDLPAQQMNEQFIQMIQRTQTAPSEADDITTVWMEVL